MDAGIAAVGTDQSGNAGIDPGRLPMMNHTKNGTGRTPGEEMGMKIVPIANGRELSTIIKEKSHTGSHGSEKMRIRTVMMTGTPSDMITDTDSGLMMTAAAADPVHGKWRSTADRFL